MKMAAFSGGFKFMLYLVLFALQRILLIGPLLANHASTPCSTDGQYIESQAKVFKKALATWN